MGTEPRARAPRRRIRLAAVLLLIQGLLMEGGVFLALPVLLVLGIDQAEAADRFAFVVPYLNDHLYLMMVMAGVFGALRVVAAIGLLCDRMWGFALAVIMCTVTLVLMILLLPAGIADGVLSGGALVLLLTAWYGAAPISPPEPGSR